jgi:uncharacterized protein YwgA
LLQEWERVGMNKFFNEAILLELIEKLREQGSWCGETHIQKAVFFLQSLFDGPLNYNFIFYKHGPFSFDLRDEITAMRAHSIISREIRHPAYRESLKPGPSGEMLNKAFDTRIAPFKREIDFIAQKFKSKGVKDLEKLSTALYVSTNCGGITIDEKAKQMHELKPHITVEQAIESIHEVDKIISDARKIKR